jgi:hypothetical protein
LENLDCNRVAQNMDRWRAGVSSVMNCQVSYNARNFVTSWANISFSRETLICAVIYLARQLASNSRISTHATCSPIKQTVYIHAISRNWDFKSPLGHVTVCSVHPQTV